MLKFTLFTESKSDMEAKIKKAFKEFDKKIIDDHQKWAKEKHEGEKAFIEKESKKPKYSNLKSYELGPKLMLQWYGSKAMYNLISSDLRSLDDALKGMKKNSEAIIERRNAQIIKALTKKGINEIPDFELKHNSDGVQGYFNIAGNDVMIRTIVAGGHNIQIRHQRTVVKVLKSKK